MENWLWEIPLLQWLELIFAVGSRVAPKQDGIICDPCDDLTLFINTVTSQKSYQADPSRAVPSSPPDWSVLGSLEQ